MSDLEDAEKRADELLEEMGSRSIANIRAAIVQAFLDGRRPHAHPSLPRGAIENLRTGEVPVVLRLRRKRDGIDAASQDGKVERTFKLEDEREMAEWLGDRTVYTWATIDHQTGELAITPNIAEGHDW